MTRVLDDEPTSPEWNPPTGPPAAAWRFVRARDGWIGGVCRGLATATGVDVGLVRLAFAVAALGGFGIVAYLVLWIVTPRAGADGLADPQPAPTSTAGTIKALLLAGAIVPVSGIWWFDPFPWDDAGVLLGLMLIGLGVVWFVHSRGSQETVSSPTPPPPPGVPPAPPMTSPRHATDDVDVAVEQSGPIDATLGMRPPPMPGTTAVTPAAPRRGGGLLIAVVMWLGVLVAIAVTLTAAALVWLEAVDVRGVGAFFVLSTVVVVTMIVAASHRPWRLLYAIGAGTFIGLLALGTLLASFEGDLGRREERVVNIEQLNSTYENAIGHLALDLSALDLDGATKDLVVKEGIGQLDIVVPATATVEVHYDVKAGELMLFGGDRDVWTASGATVSRGREGAGTLRIDASLGGGTMRVCRPSSANLGAIECW